MTDPDISPQKSPSPEKKCNSLSRKKKKTRKKTDNYLMAHRSHRRFFVLGSELVLLPLMTFEGCYYKYSPGVEERGREREMA